MKAGILCELIKLYLKKQLLGKRIIGIREEQESPGRAFPETFENHFQ
jgi:hypothetical protein